LHGKNGEHPLVPGFNTAAHPDRPHAAGGYCDAASSEIGGDALLAMFGMRECLRQDCLFDGRAYTVFQQRLAPADIAQGSRPALFEQVSEAVIAVARIAERIAGLGHASELARKTQQTQLLFHGAALAFHYDPSFTSVSCIFTYFRSL